MTYTLDVVNVHEFFGSLEKDVDEDTRIAKVDYHQMHGELVVRLNIEYLEHQKLHSCWFYMMCDNVPFLRISHTCATGRSGFLHRSVSECLQRHLSKRRPFGLVYSFRSGGQVYFACNHALAIHDEWLHPDLREPTTNLFFNTFAAMHADVKYALAALTV